MAVGLAAAEANALLTAHAGGTAHTPPAAYWIQVHVGDPGAAGTTNLAANTTRKQVTWAVAANGSISNSAALTWTAGEVTTNEDYSHWTGWSASTGTVRFLASGTVTAPAAVAGQEYIIAVGDLDLTLTIAAT